jgi:hypothetical protein
MSGTEPVSRIHTLLYPDNVQSFKKISLKTKSNCYKILEQHTEYSSNRQKLQIKFIIFIKLFKHKSEMCICSPTMRQFSQLPQAVLPVILPQANAIRVEAS